MSGSRSRKESLVEEENGERERERERERGEEGKNPDNSIIIQTGKENV